MKRYAILAGIVAAVLLFLLFFGRLRGNSRTQPAPEAAREAPAATNSLPNESAIRTAPEHIPADIDAADPIRGSQQESIVRSFNETANVPVAFYGQVVDQDTNPLQNVQVRMVISEEYMLPSLRAKTGTTTSLQRQTTPDGRFEATGLKGHRVTIRGLAKDGYEPELGFREKYGDYGAQSGSFTDPVVFRMWATNIHETLLSGEKSFVVIPDGRHYGIDLVKGTIAEGDDGDLVTWIKRPEKVRWGQRYDWSCELAVPAGGLLESSQYGMFRAPEAGYTNAFVQETEANSHWWGFLTGDKRFYVRLRNGQMYGRITINLYADYHGRQPAMIRLSYAINPSGSRLLR